MTEEPVILLSPSFAAPGSSPVKPWMWSWEASKHSGSHAGTHQHRIAEHGATVSCLSIGLATDLASG